MVYMRNGGGQISRDPYLLGILITTILFSLPAIFPDKAGLLHGFMSLPAFFYLIRFGRKRGTSLVTGSALTAGLIAVFFGSLPTLIISLSVLPLGYVLARAVKNNFSPMQAGLEGIILLISLWGLIGFGYAAIEHTNPYKAILSDVDDNLQAAYSQYTASADLPADTRREIGAAFKELRSLIPRIFPALLLSTCLWIVWLNLVLGHWLLKRQKPPLSVWNDFKAWRLPDTLIWLLITAALCLLLPFDALTRLGLNMAIIACGLYFLQGLAVLSTLLEKWSVPPALRPVLFFLMAIQAVGIIMLIAAGVAAVWVDFGKTRDQGEN